MGEMAALIKLLTWKEKPKVHKRVCWWVSLKQIRVCRSYGFRLNSGPDSGANLRVEQWKKKEKDLHDFNNFNYFQLQSKNKKQRRQDCSTLVCNDAELTSKEFTKLLKDASPIKYAWPVAKFNQARSLLRRTRSRSVKLIVAQDLEWRASHFPAYAECNGVHVNKNKSELSFRKCSASIGGIVFI